MLIPYSDFLQLWEKASKLEPEKKDPLPPIDAAIVHSEYSGVVEGDIIKFHGELKISALKNKWAKLKLNYDNLAVTSITLNNEVPLVHTKNKDLELILPTKGEYLLKIDFSTKVDSLPGKKIISFNLPSSPLTKINLTIPGTDLDVKIEPMLSKNSKVVNDRTEFSAFLSPSGKVNISWLVKTEKKEEKSLIFAKVLSHLNITESVYTINSDINFSIMQAKTDQFKVMIPKDLSLVRVDGANIKNWEINKDNELVVKLYEKIDNTYRLRLITEKFKELEDKTFNFPSIKIIDAKREDGVIIVTADPSLRIKIKENDKVTQIDSSKLKDYSRYQKALFVYKYFRHPFILSFNISKINPKIRVSQKNMISIYESMIDFDIDLRYTIKDAGVFNLKIDVPKKFRVTKVGNDQIIDSYTVVEKNDEYNTLDVFLKNKAIGSFRLPLLLEADKKDENLDFELPKVKCLAVEKEEGVIVISLRKNLKLTTSDSKALRPLSLEEINGMGFDNKDRKNEFAAGYKFLSTNYFCKLAIEKRKSRVSALVNRSVDVKETVIKVVDLIQYNILYAPKRKFSIKVPSSISKDVHIFGNNIKEKKYKEDKDKDFGIWEIELHSPQSDKYQLRIETEKKIEAIKTGEKSSHKIPSIFVQDVFNESGFISIEKDHNIQVTSKTNNLEPIDTKELPSTMNRTYAALAYKYLSHPYSLTLESTRHDYEKVLSAIVTAAHFDIIVSEEGVAKTEAVYRIKNTNLQSLEIEMPKGIEKIYSVHISGKQAAISKGNTPNSKIIMLPKNIQSGQEFTIRIIFQQLIRDSFDNFGRIKITDAQILGVPVLKVSWRLYLPSSYSYVYLKGSINPENYMAKDYEQINSLVGSRQIHSRKNIAYNQQAILRQNDEKSLIGIDVDLVREGKMYNLSKLDKNAYLNVLYIKKSSMYQILTVIFILVLVSFYFYPIKFQIKPFPFLIKSFVCIYVIKIFVPQGFKYFLLVSLSGVLLSAVIHMLKHFYCKNKCLHSHDKNQSQEKNAL